VRVLSDFAAGTVNDGSFAATLPSDVDPGTGR